MTGLFLEGNRFSIVNNKNKSSELIFTAFIFNKIQKITRFFFERKFHSLNKSVAAP